MILVQYHISIPENCSAQKNPLVPFIKIQVLTNKHYDHASEKGSYK